MEATILYKHPLIIHPFILSIYPLVFLYTVNWGGLSLDSVLRIAFVTLLISTLSFGVLGWLTKQWERSGLIVSGILLLFFYYGQLHEYLFVQQNIKLGQHRYLIPIWGLVFCLMQCVWLPKFRFSLLTRIFNVVSGLLLIGAICNLIYQSYAYSKPVLPAGGVATALAGSSPAREAKSSPPDIYYIILDGYARQDTLAELYEYPDNDLISYLKSNGFYIATKSSANYADTKLSLSSSLNMSHILHLREALGENSTDKKLLYRMLKDNAVVKFLKAKGYTYVHYASGYEPTQNSRWADITVNCYPGVSDQIFPLLLKTTLLSPLEYHFPYHWFYNAQQEREKKLCIFSSINTTLEARSPKFVFMHILLPHPPFLFKRDGTLNEIGATPAIYLWQDQNKYKEQLIFLNQKVKALVEQILVRSASPPVIIVQGDHGPASTIDFDNPSEQGIKERMRILNAYLLPGAGPKGLYDSISPVNSFRVVFSQYFGANLKLEEDKSYLSTWYRPYKFTDVTSVLADRLSSEGTPAE